jgi:hypothetical protein
MSPQCWPRDLVPRNQRVEIHLSPCAWSRSFQIHPLLAFGRCRCGVVGVKTMSGTMPSVRVKNLRGEWSGQVVALNAPAILLNNRRGPGANFRGVAARSVRCAS